MQKMSPARRILVYAIILILAFAASTVLATDGEEAYVSNMYATFWSLVPPIIAIVLALVTKEVYSSLFVGILAGALFYSNFNIELAFNTFVSDGFITKLSDTWNVGILIFLVILGSMVVVMRKAGGSAAYGAWARERIKSRKGASLATFGLGVLIFVDDYFNCLTVGSVMRPVTDTHGISRAKLAYIIDATAAPICMIAPISSWAAAVTGVVEGVDGLTLFVSAIPYNLYSLLTIVMVVALALMRFDFGPMRIHEENAKKGDLFTTDARPYGNEAEETVQKGRDGVLDLVIPMVILIASCILGMVYTGGFFSGTDFVTAFSECDASFGLAIGSVIAFILTFFYCMLRRIISFKDFMECIPEGFKAMVPAILILSFAWTLSAMTGLLGGADYVHNLLQTYAPNLALFMPAIIFVVAAILAFATGTSWGTFGILLPIVTEVFAPGTEILVICVSACLAGAVCGDHCSPISDTTIMASTGARCDHVTHVSTQLPYALFVAAISFVFYILAGFVQNAWIVLPIAIVVLLVALFCVKSICNKKYS